jgi:hypothetical protein
MVAPERAQTLQGLKRVLIEAGLAVVLERPLEESLAIYHQIGNDRGMLAAVATLNDSVTRLRSRVCSGGSRYSIQRL